MEQQRSATDYCARCDSPVQRQYERSLDLQGVWRHYFRLACQGCGWSLRYFQSTSRPDPPGGVTSRNRSTSA